MLTKPPVIVNRDGQWQVLIEFVRGDGHGSLSFASVSGRRRTGKSFLLRQFCALTGGLYIQAEPDDTVRQAQARFAEAIRRYAPDAEVPEVEPADLHGWESLLVCALRATSSRSNGQVVPPLVIDEFPYLLAHSPTLRGDLKRLHDEVNTGGRELDGRLVFCGSAMSVIHELISGQGPLFGRVDRMLVFEPFDYRHAAEFWGIDDPAVMFRLDAILGGSPGYRDRLFRNTKPPTGLDEVNRWIAVEFFDPDRLFSLNELMHLLREDPRIRDKMIYYWILDAVAGGYCTPAKIGGELSMGKQELAAPLDLLAEMGYLRWERDLLNPVRAVVGITDPLIRFHQYVVRPMLDFVESGAAPEDAWLAEATQARFRSQILGPHFENLCRIWARKYAPRDLSLSEPFGPIGSAVIQDEQARAKHELDVVALAPGTTSAGRHKVIRLLGEAKATGRQRSVADLARLEHIAQILGGQGHDVSRLTYALFSLSGFTDGLAEAASDRSDLVLVGLGDLYGRLASDS
jgi:hypothetical protein